MKFVSSFSSLSFLFLLLFIQFFVVCSFSLIPSSPVPEEDEIYAIPGWEGPLPSRTFSGYLKVGQTSKKLHYVLSFAEDKDPAHAPLLLWLNGGPGCSSLDGYIYENGPFELPFYLPSSGESTEEYMQNLKLSKRENRWTKLYNVIWLESPVGVGFSTSSNASDYAANTDDSTAQDALQAMISFNAKFPFFENHNFYIVGESYGGVYVPTLAEAIYEASLRGEYTTPILKGIGVGNGCTGTEVGICSASPQGTAMLYQYLLGQSFIDLSLKEKIDENCDLKGAVHKQQPLSKKCQTLLEKASFEVGFINLYDIYGDCISSYPMSTESQTQTEVSSLVNLTKQQQLQTPFLPPSWSSIAFANFKASIPGPVACINSFAATAFFSDKEVQKAYHIQPPSFAGDDWEFSVCGQVKGWKYKSTRPNLPRDTYPTLIQNMNVVIYNGDWDACVPYTDNEFWTSQLSIDLSLKTKKPWHTWMYNSSTAGGGSQVAGHAVVYDVDINSKEKTKKTNPSSKRSERGGGFTFITIRGGRHEVPETAGEQALEMIRRLTGNIDF